MNNQPINLHVKEPILLIDFLIKQQGVSRNAAKSLLTHRQVLVDKVITSRATAELKIGQQVQITRKGHKEFHNRMLNIIYEDNFILIVDKHEGLLSMATARQRETTAHSILNEYVQRTNRRSRVFIVHRLDRETSGLMIFAKDEKTKITLQDNWHNIVTDRRYVAVVSGSMEKDNGTVVSWLKDNKVFITYSSISDNGGERAITHYQTIKRTPEFSLVELKLETGRKNQIRVHMQDLNHPVVGDAKYGNGDNPINRLALHAFKIEFYHPITHELLKFETPYPPLFKKLFNKK
jgi:23S rRNA pseudouridine1911/1915/1917 synthase